MGDKEGLKSLLRKAQDRFIFHNRALYYVLKYLLFKRDNLEDNSYILGINEASFVADAMKFVDGLNRK